MSPMSSISEFDRATNFKPQDETARNAAIRVTAEAHIRVRSLLGEVLQAASGTNASVIGLKKVQGTFDRICEQAYEKRYPGHD